MLSWCEKRPNFFQLWKAYYLYKWKKLDRINTIKHFFYQSKRSNFFQLWKLTRPRLWFAWSATENESADPTTLKSIPTRYKHSFIHSYIHSYNNLFIHLFIMSFVYTFITTLKSILMRYKHSSIHWLIHWLIYNIVHSLQLWKAY